MKVAVLTVKSTAGSMMRLADVLLPAEREELASRLYQQALNVLGAVSPARRTHRGFDGQCGARRGSSRRRSDLEGTESVEP